MDINCTIFGQSVAFFIFVFLCIKYIWPPLIKVIEGRRKKIADSFSSIKAAEKDIRNSYIKIDKIICDATLQSKVIIDKAKKSRDMILQKVKEEAIIEKNRILEDAYVKIALRKKFVERELHENAVSMTILVVEKILGNTMDFNKNHDFINYIISKLR